MLSRFFPDRFLLILLATIAVATLLPAQGRALSAASAISNIAIFSLFFFHGLRLPAKAVWDGVRHWRLQLAVLVGSFAVVPLIGLSLSWLMPGVLSPILWTGVLFLCVLPSTVQAAIASASMAGGNVAASIVSAAISNLAAVLLTPLLFTAIAHVSGGAGDLSAIGRIATLLLLPFALGQIARVWLAPWAERHKVWIGRLDRTTIVIALYVAFSAAANEGIWARLDGLELLRLAGIVVVMLSLGFTANWMIGGMIGLSRADRATLLFSGTHKSLATGAPMARILFPAAQAGLMIVPLMIYHQLQLMVSAWIATRLAKDNEQGGV